MNSILRQAGKEGFVYLARHQRDGHAVGYLITELDGSPVAFVQGTGADALSASMLIRESSDMASHDGSRGCRIWNLREITRHGDFIGMPVFLFSLVFCPVDESGNLMQLAGGRHFVMLTLRTEDNESVLRFYAYRAHDAMKLPAWLRPADLPAGACAADACAAAGNDQLSIVN